MRFLRNLLWAVSVVAITGSTAWAQSSVYDIEIVVFENIDESDAQREFWPANPGSPSLVEARRHDPAATRLGELAQRIRYAPDYRLLIHRAWRQSVYSERSAVPMEIRSASEGNRASALEGTVTIWRGRYLHAKIDLLYELQEPIATPYPTPTSSLTSASQTGMAGLATAAPPESMTNYVRMRQSRRMRSKELHYLDNPKLGVLIQALPVN